MPTQPPITILGAGLSGLTLARSLTNAGLPFALYERSKSLPGHNYGLTLHPRAYIPLLRLLDLDEAAFRSQVAIGRQRFKAPGRVLPSEGGEVGEGMEKAIRVHRKSLERLLARGLDVKYGAQTGIMDAPRGGGEGRGRQRLVRFVEGGGNFIVDTRGVHSENKTTLLWGSRNRVLPFVVFRGTRRVGWEVWMECYEKSFVGGNVLVHRKGKVRLEVSVCDYDDVEGSVDISYIYSRPVRRKDGLWKPDRELGDANFVPAAFGDEISELGELEGPFRDAFNVKKMKGDRILNWLMRSSLVTEQEAVGLATRGFVMVGDAAHAHPILGGEGANEAIRDGFELGQHIVKHGTGKMGELIEANYERWMKGVKFSEKRLRRIHRVEGSSL